jgi:hypothetical protein
MEHYVGLDVSLKQTSICVVNQMGSVVGGYERRLEGDGIEDQFRPF